MLFAEGIAYQCRQMNDNIGIRYRSGNQFPVEYIPLDELKIGIDEQLHDGLRSIMESIQNSDPVAIAQESTNENTAVEASATRDHHQRRISH